MPKTKTDTSEITAEPAVAPTPTPRRIPIADLVKNADQDKFYAPYSAEQDEAVLASLKHYGQRDPIVVRPRRGRKGKMCYEIIDGHQRARLIAQLGHTEILAIVRDDLADDDDAARQLFFSCNRDRRQLTPMAVAKIEIARMELEFGREPGGLDNYEEGKAEARIRAVLGGSPKSARRYLLILTKTPLEVQRAVERGLLKVEVAPRIAFICDEDKQALANELNGLTDKAAVAGVVARYVRARQPRHNRQETAVDRLAQYLPVVIAEVGEQAEKAAPVNVARYAALFRQAVPLMRGLVGKAEVGEEEHRAALQAIHDDLARLSDQ